MTNKPNDTKELREKVGRPTAYLKSELRKRAKSLEAALQNGMDKGNHLVARGGLVWFKKIVEVARLIEKDFIRQERQKSYEQGFIAGGHASGEQANEIHAIELHQERQKARAEIKKLNWELQDPIELSIRLDDAGEEE